MPDAISPTPPLAAATRPALPGDGPCPLPGEDALELDLLRRAVANDWGPRDAYERHWAGELVAAMHRQQLLRGLELKALATAEAENPPTEATLKPLLGFARYGARIDKDIGAALRALRVLRDRPDAWIEEKQKGTPEPERRAFAAACTREPEPATATLRTASLPTRTREPESPAAQPPLNRHERRRLEALQRQAERRAA